MSFKVAKDRLSEKITQLEATAVGLKPWQIGGELATVLRQKNFPLAEDIDYNTTIRHAPVVK